MSGSRISPRVIVTEHVRALAGQDGRLSVIDLARQFVLPVLLGGTAVLWGDASINLNTAAALVTVGGIFAAFTFQLALSVHAQALVFASERPEPSERTSSRSEALRMLSANASYASLAALLGSIAALGAGIVERGVPEDVAVGASIALFAHLSIVLLLVLRRVFLDTQNTLTQISTGQHRPDSYV